MWYSWYRSTTPIIKFNVPSDWKTDTIYDNPGDGQLLHKWYNISSDIFKDIKWTYNNYNRRWNNDWILCCNGIVISRGYSIKGYSFPEFSEVPRISIYDYDGKLELSLDRNALSNDKLPFEKQLVVDVCKDIIAKLLITTDILDENRNIKQTNFIHRSLSKEQWLKKLSEYIIFKEGYCLNNSYNIQKLDKKNITYVWMNNECNLNEKIFDFGDGIVIKYEKVTKTNFKYILEKSNLTIDKIYEVKDRRFYIDQAMFKVITDEEKSYLTKRFIKNMVYDCKDEKYICIDVGTPSKSRIDMTELNRSENINLIAEYYLGNCKLVYDEIDIFSDIMTEYIGDDVIIPFSLEERKKKYPKAFRELQKYMKAYSDSEK